MVRKPDVEMREIKNGQMVDDKKEKDGYVVPPDGGWGWVVMMASFSCNIFVDGIIFSFGPILQRLEEVYDTSAAETAWVSSLLAGFYLIAGPFVSALSNLYGFRTVAILGSILGCIAFSVSYFATSLSHLFVTIGFLGGVGFGLVYVPAVVAVGYYFEKKRALATGIAVCGSGIGTFMFAPLTTYLIDQYSWRGTILIYAGLILNCAVFGALFRPLEPVSKKRERENAKIPTSDGTPLMLRIKRARDEKMQSEAANSCANVAKASDFKSSTNSLSNVKLVGIKQKRSSTLSESSSSLRKKNDEHEKENLLTAQDKQVAAISSSKRSIQSSSKNLHHDEAQPMDREDIFYTGSLHRLPQYSNDPEHYHASVTRLPETEETSHSQKSCLPESARRTLSSMLDLSLLKSPSFIVICFSGFLTFLGFFVPFMYLGARATESGIEKESAAILISIIGVTNTIGRVLCGWLSDHPKVSVLFVNNAALTLGGLVTAISPFFPSYEMLIVYSCLFGISIACFASLRSILLVELLGLERLTNAFGIMLLFTGVAATLGGPMAGMFYDATRDYNASFYLSGSMIFLSGVLCYPLGCINRWEKKKHSQVTPIPEPVAVVAA